MPRESGKKRSPRYKINADQPTSTARIDVAASSVREESMAAVNMLYFQRSKECFSSWSFTDLKAFSGFVEKMAGKTQGQITSSTQICHSHKGKTAKSLPVAVSKDVHMYSLDVGPKGRVHGFFSQGIFYLVWIDRDGTILGH